MTEHDYSSAISATALFGAIAILFGSMFWSIGVSESARETAKPAAIAACLSVGGMEYVRGDCSAILSD